MRYTKKSYNILILSTLLVVSYHTLKSYHRPEIPMKIFFEESDIGVRDPNVTCIFPILHPFHESILVYIKMPSPLRCRGESLYLMQIFNSHLSWNASSGYSPDQYQCEYSEIYEKNVESVFGPYIPFRGSVKPNSDFVYARCSNIFGYVVYSDYFATVQKKKHIRKQRNKEMSVVVIGLDSMSRLNFLRQLPNTYQYMKNVMNSVTMLGYNKVGSNTFPNVMSMLMGTTPPPEPYGHFEGFEFIWKDFAEAGAATLYSEDKSGINMFNYWGSGLLQPPTLHYGHTYWLSIERSVMEAKSAPFCLGPHPKHKIHFDYILSFLREYKESPKFAFTLYNEAIHNHVNTPGIMDNDMLSFMRTSYEEGLFNRSIVMVLGDHGNRMDPIRQTEVGRIEDYMPLLSITIPSWVKKEWHDALEINRARLVNAFDIYQTFVHALSTLGNGQKFKYHISKLKETRYGSSLFSVVDADRTCSSAGIPEWYCLCQSQNATELKADDSRSKEAIEFVISFINNNVLDLKLCKKLSLKRVLKVTTQNITDQISRLSLSFITYPGNGTFEVGVEFLSTENTYSLIGPIIRTNAYGEQSFCVPPELYRKNKLITSTCYCHSLSTD